jgi:Flp pilus assembly protein TadD
MTEPLPLPDCHYFSAALGWFELGNLVESKAELRHLSREHLDHPAVLELRWLIGAREQRWPECYELAEKLIQFAPENPSGWLHRAYALRRLPKGGGVEQAWTALLDAFERFPREATIAYNLSCYACQMRKLDDARLWLERAMQFGDRERLRNLALADEDLRPLWDEIRGGNQAA